VDGRTGKVLAGEEYGGIVASSLRLFDELIRLNEGDADNYRKAGAKAWAWLRDHPLDPGSKAYDKWSGYFEDVPKNPKNVNQAAPTYTAYYILSRTDPRAIDPDWAKHVSHLIDWVRRSLGRGPFYGAWGVDEQGEAPSYRGCCSPVGLGSDTSRWAAINALYYEKTRDSQARENAFRSLNYATYFAAADGKISCCGEGSMGLYWFSTWAFVQLFHHIIHGEGLGGGQYWFSDGYSDYLRHFNWAMGAIPELAPVGQNHLLQTSTVVQRVQYGERSLHYWTFDKDGTEVLRLAYRPARVTAGSQFLGQRDDLAGEGYTIESLPGGDYVVRIRHIQSSEVQVMGK